MGWSRVISVAVLVFLGLMTAVAFWAVWINRGSEKIVTAAIPIAVAALIGIFLSVFVFGGESPINAKFATSFLYREADRGPVYVPYRFHLMNLFEVSQLFQQNPAISSVEGSLLYHHLLQKSILATLTERYRARWEVEIVEVSHALGHEEHFGPAPESTEPSTILTKQQIEALLKENLFATVKSSPLMDQLALPPSTEPEVRPPKKDAVGFETGEILLTNPFCSVRIKTQLSGGFRGIGSYSRIAGYSESQNKEFWTSNYFVTIQAKFSKMRSGHPKMPKYKACVSR